MKPLRSALASLLLLATAALAACDDDVTGVVRTDVLRASAAGDGVRLESLVAEPVYYFVADREALALIDWAVCVEPARCRSVPPHDAVTVPPAEIAGNQPGSHEVVVYHWLLVRRDGAWAPDSIRGTIVRR